MTQVQQKQETAQTFSCSGCGGRPVWDPESGKLKCPYCGHFTDVTADETKPEEYPLEAAPTAAQPAARPPGGLRILGSGS